MPNWCYSNIVFYSTNRLRVEKMYNDFNKIINGESSEPNDFGHGWMGDFASKYFPEIELNKINCRGSVINISELDYADDDNPETGEEENYRFFTIQTETAWAPKMGLWREIIKKKYPDVKIAYDSEEPGMGYYYKYDTTPNRIFTYGSTHYIDGYIPTIEKNNDVVKSLYIRDYLDFGCTVEQIHGFLKEYLPFDLDYTKNLSDLESELNEKLNEFQNKNECDEDLYVCFEEYAVVSPDEYDFFNY